MICYIFRSSLTIILYLNVRSMTQNLTYLNVIYLHIILKLKNVSIHPFGENCYF